MGNKGEEIRGALDEGGMRATMFTKEERREGEEGSSAGTRRGGQEPTGCWGKGKAHSAQGRRVRHDAAATRKWGAKGPIQTAFAGHAAK